MAYGLTHKQPDISDTSDTVRHLLRELEASGFEFSVQDNRELRCDYPEGAMTSEIRDRVREAKAEIVKLLKQPHVVGRVRNWHPHTSPPYLNVVRHNQVGVNRSGQSSRTHPYAVINTIAWRECPWDLKETTWFTDPASISGMRQLPYAAVARDGVAA